MNDFEQWIENHLPKTQELEQYFDRLWPICRSILGKGFRDSLDILSEIVPFERLSIPSNTKVFDWTVPSEWNIEDAWIEDSSENRIVDFKKNNLHVLGYSAPMDAMLTLEELQPFLYSLPDQPTAIPYITSYYKERSGFCLSDIQRKSLNPGTYRAVIQSSLKPGNLVIGDCVLPATIKTNDEVLISTYMCHPSLANNELSGPLVTAFLWKAISQLKSRKFNYRFVVLPETIGSIAYLSKFGDHLKEHCKAGFVVNCCGDNKNITYKKTRSGLFNVDKVVENVLIHCEKPFKIVDFFPSGSDERQYCSPGFNLPVGSLMRSMYGTYPEYHTSLDNKDFISFDAMRESISLYLKVLLSLQENIKLRNMSPFCEPMLGPRGLYPNLGQKKIEDRVGKMMWLLNLSDGENDLLTIAQRANCSLLELAEIANPLIAQGLLLK